MTPSEPGPPRVGDGIAFLLVDRRGRPLACSRGFTHLFGEPARLTPWDAHGRALPKPQWPQALLGRGDSFCSSFTLKLSDGTRRPFSVSGEPLWAGDGSSAGGVLVVEEAAQVDRLGHVAALVSHELRTPLTVLHAALQLIERSLQAGDERAAQRYLSDALAETRQMNVLTGQLLDAARLSDGILRLRKEPLRLGPLVRDVCAHAQGLTRGQHIELSAVDDDIRVNADASRIEQLLMQLLVNAIVYAPGTSGIEVVLRREGGEAVLEVRDHGGSLRGERLAPLADPFYQAPRQDRSSRAGLGLGLYVCRELAELHGGRLTISAHESGGSIFAVRLPLLAAEDQDMAPRVRQDVSPARSLVP